MAKKMMSWRRKQHRRKEDADENEDDQQDEDVSREADEADEDVRMMRVRRRNRTPNEPLEWTLKGTLRPPKKKRLII